MNDGTLIELPTREGDCLEKATGFFLVPDSKTGQRKEPVEPNKESTFVLLEVLQVAMICPNQECILSPVQPMSPLFQGQLDKPTVHSGGQAMLQQDTKMKHVKSQKYFFSKINSMSMI